MQGFGRGRTLRCAALAVALGTGALAEGDPAGAGSAARPGPPAAPEAGGPRRWQVAAGPALTLRAAPAAAADAVAALAPGTVLANGGCRRAAGAVWCAVRPLRDGTARGFAPLAALAPVPGPDGVVAQGPDDSERRARRGDFDARETIRCAQEPSQPITPCAAAIARTPGGDAAVVVTFPSGFRRTLLFGHGMFLRGNATMSGVGTDTAWRRDGETHFVRVDDQRFELPETAIVPR